MAGSSSPVRKRTCPPRRLSADINDCEGRWITPGLIDCHTHLVHAGNRANEFEMRLAGATYEEVAKAGGGIVSSVKALRAASEDDLVAQSLPRLDALIAEGVTTIEIKSGYGLDLENEAKSLKAARRLGDERPVTVRTTFLGAHALPPEAKGDKDSFIDLVANEMLPAIAEQKLADAVDGFCEGIAFSPAQISRVFERARVLGLPVKLHADQLSNLGGAALAASFGALSADHLEYTDKAGAIAMAGAGTVAVILPGAYLLHPRDEEAADRPFPRLRREDGRRDRLQSRHVAADLAAAHHEHGRDPVRHDRRGMPCRRDPRGRPCARSFGRNRNAGSRQMGRPRRLGHREPGRACLPHGVQSVAFARLERPMTTLVLKSGDATLADWRAIYRGAVPALDPACKPKIAASAATVARIVAKGEPVYGINTGFGKLASVRIPASDLETLQRNIVLSHAAGVGEPMPVAVARLMMALKLASLVARRVRRAAGNGRRCSKPCWQTTSSRSCPHRGRLVRRVTLRRCRI